MNSYTVIFVPDTNYAWLEVQMEIDSPSLDHAARVATKYLQAEFNTMFHTVRVQEHDINGKFSRELRYELVTTRGVSRVND